VGIIYRVDSDAIVIADVFSKKAVIERPKKRFREYDRELREDVPGGADLPGRVGEYEVMPPNREAMGAKGKTEEPTFAATTAAAPLVELWPVPVSP
jgi:hypothetical protein